MDLYKIAPWDLSETQEKLIKMNGFYLKKYLMDWGILDELVDCSNLQSLPLRKFIPAPLWVDKFYEISDVYWDDDLETIAPLKMVR